MTIVARLTINDYPVVIGDLLLSIKDPLALPPSVPTAENLSMLFPAGSACLPYGLRQKVAVVADNLVVGWSGVFNTAKDVIAELKRKSQSQPFTYDALMRHFEGLSQSVWDEIGLVGVLEESKERVFHWRRARKFWEAETTHFGKATLLGSGRDDVGKTLVDVQQLPVGLERNLREWEQTLGCCLQMTGYWMQLEIATLQSLEKLYGGGYEIATFIDDKYRKIDEITYMFWHARIDGDGIRFAFAPHKALRYAYVNDLLVIRSVTFDDNKDVPTVADQKFFYVVSKPQ